MAMIDKYALPEMSKIFSDENRYQLMTDVAVTACEAMADIGQIPVEELAEGDIPQGQIAGVQHRTGVDLHRSRHTHPHGAYLLRRQAALFRQALSQRHQCLHQCFLVGDLGNFALFHGEDAALVVHQPRLQVGAADVNADVVHFCSSLCRVRASIWRSTRSTKSLAGL